MIVVHTSTSVSPFQNPSIAFSRVASSICPWAMPTRASGTLSRSHAANRSMVWTSDRTQNTCPPRRSSRRTAAMATDWSYGPTYVRTGWRSSGGVSTTLISRIPDSAISSVRGIGVAVIVRTSTLTRSRFSRSLWATPKRCSSSMIRSPRSLNRTSRESRRRVPLGERHLVLFGKQRGGDQDGHLLAVQHRLERRPHGDLGLAVSDIAAQEPIHRFRSLHRPLHL